jgi:hypothetical protein
LLALPLVACEVMDLQATFIILSATPPPLHRLSSSGHRLPLVALELQSTCVGESFKVKPPDFTALEEDPKGDALVCSRRSAWLVAKCHGWTIKLLVPRCCLPNKVVSRQCIARPRSCSLCPLHDGASSGLHFVAAARPGRSGL